MNQFLMPSLGADMDYGVLLEWYINPGDTVHKGDIVAAVETEKGVIEIEIWQSGVIESLSAKAGDKIPVGGVLALLRADQATVELPQKSLAEKALILTPDIEPHPLQEKPEFLPESAPQLISSNLQRRRISPLARKMAENWNIDLSQIEGTGEGGAIVRVDIERALETKVTDQGKPELSQTLSLPLTGMRRTISRAMQKSKREIPHYYLQTDMNLEIGLNWLREQNLNRSVDKRLLPAALLLKATGLAAKEFPDLNGYWQNDEHLACDEVNIGVVSSLREGGVLAPIIHQVDRLSIDEVMANLLDLVNRARSAKLRASDLNGATITVTNLGDRGVDAVFGVIHPPQLAIVGFGRIRQIPWAEKGMIGAKDIVTVSLSADHRVSDGHRGARFLEKIAHHLLHPELL